MEFCNFAPCERLEKVVWPVTIRRVDPAQIAERDSQVVGAKYGRIVYLRFKEREVEGLDFALEVDGVERVSDGGRLNSSVAQSDVWVNQFMQLRDRYPPAHCVAQVGNRWQLK